MTSEQQTILTEIAQEASVLGIEMAEKYEKELVVSLQEKHGVTVTRPDKSEFKSALTSLQKTLVRDLKLDEAVAAINK